MKIFKIRKVGSNKYMDTKTYLESQKGGTTFKQLKRAKDSVKEIKNYLKNESFEIVEFELVENKIHKNF